MKRFEKFMHMVRQRGLHKKAYILAGVNPLKSARAAEFMQKRVAGMIVPDEIVERMRKATNPKAEGVKICVEQIEQLKKIEGVAGVHIMAIAWEEVVPEIVDKASIKPEPLTLTS